MSRTTCFVETKHNGTIASNSTSLHITGLPYAADWRSNDYADWKMTNISDKGKYLQVANGQLGCIISPGFYIPSGSAINTIPAIAAVTSATSLGDYDKSYIYAGTQGSSAQESGNNVTIRVVTGASATGEMNNTPLTALSAAVTINTTSPCVVFTAKDFALFCNTYVYQAKIEYKE